MLLTLIVVDPGRNPRRHPDLAFPSISTRPGANAVNLLGQG
ncbi:hypothetical protein [Gordonia sp. YY1]|nr:hypothetical protein [Gordonia sp. YY1]KAF0968287.1 hypothetical protein BPODLACK_03228 [Gordonia sp. YY1]